jgi:hypothetical protein
MLLVLDEHVWTLELRSHCNALDFPKRQGAKVSRISWYAWRVSSPGDRSQADVILQLDVGITSRYCIHKL